MSTSSSNVSTEAKHGKKMIEVSLRFWTNDLAESKDKIKPKHAWSSGVVRMQGNESHGIVPGNPKPFHSLLDVGGRDRGGIDKPRRHSPSKQKNEKVHVGVQVKILNPIDVGFP